MFWELTFQSLFCWIHGLRLFCFVIVPTLKAWFQSLFCWIHGLRPAVERDHEWAAEWFQSLFCWIHGLRPFPPESTAVVSHMFQSLFCWIHGLRPFYIHYNNFILVCVSILVLLDSWAKTSMLVLKLLCLFRVSILVLLDSWAKTWRLLQSWSPGDGVSILVLLDSWAKTIPRQNRRNDLDMFQSLFCWIHGLRLIHYSLHGRNQTRFQSLFCWIHGLRPRLTVCWHCRQSPVSILVLLDSWAKTRLFDPEGVRPWKCFNPCFVGFMG